MSAREVISFKGTRHGILMSIVEDEPFGRVMEELSAKVEKDLPFFQGSSLSLDLGWREMTEQDLNELMTFLSEQKLKLMGIISSSLATRQIAEARGLKVIIGRLGLADHHGRTRTPTVTKLSEVAASEAAAPPSVRPVSVPVPAAQTTVQTVAASAPAEAPAPRTTASVAVAVPAPVVQAPVEETILIKKTIRSGQSIEHHGNLVIYGDVNPGAELKAGGDIIVIGTLRGIAQAGRKDNGDPASITATRFLPTQIRIKDKIEENFDRKITKQNMPVTATLSNGKIEYKIHF
ncbi:MAG: septum site-determining protein MinC [Firmicutes bacterium]|nr:septum site-determining protein MinC [Bacillota bacterium]